MSGVAPTACACRSQLPDSNLDSAIWNCLVDFTWRKWSSLLGWLFGRGRLALIPSGIALVMFVVAGVIDQRQLYRKHPPAWLRPRSSWSFRHRFRMHLRMGHPVLRLFFVVPGHTMATRLQLAVALVNQLALTLSSIVTWTDTRQCATEAYLMAAMISFATGIVGAFVCRLVLRWGYRHTFWGQLAQLQWASSRRSSVVPSNRVMPIAHKLRRNVLSTAWALADLSGRASRLTRYSRAARASHNGAARDAQNRYSADSADADDSDRCDANGPGQLLPFDDGESSLTFMGHSEIGATRKKLARPRRKSFEVFSRGLSAVQISLRLDDEDAPRPPVAPPPELSQMPGVDARRSSTPGPVPVAPQRRRSLCTTRGRTAPVASPPQSLVPQASPPASPPPGPLLYPQHDSDTLSQPRDPLYPSRDGETPSLPRRLSSRLRSSAAAVTTSVNVVEAVVTAATQRQYRQGSVQLPQEAATEPIDDDDEIDEIDTAAVVAGDANASVEDLPDACAGASQRCSPCLAAPRSPESSRCLRETPDARAFAHLSLSPFQLTLPLGGATAPQSSIAVPRESCRGSLRDRPCRESCSESCTGSCNKSCIESAPRYTQDSTVASLQAWLTSGPCSRPTATGGAGRGGKHGVNEDSLEEPPDGVAHVWYNMRIRDDQLHSRNGCVVVLPKGGGFAEVHSVESSGCTPLLPPCVRSRHADITLHKLPGEMSLDRDALLVRGPALLHELGAAWRLLVAWVINLFVLACSSLFLACIASSPQQTSNSAFTQAAARGYGVSLALTFLVKDPLVAAFIAI